MHIKRESFEWYCFHVEIGKRKKRQEELLFLALPISRPRALAGTLVCYFSSEEHSRLQAYYAREYRNLTRRPRTPCWPCRGQQHLVKPNWPVLSLFFHCLQWWRQLVAGQSHEQFSHSSCPHHFFYWCIDWLSNQIYWMIKLNEMWQCLFNTQAGVHHGKYPSPS
jgi:hypothetical protein